MSEKQSVSLFRIAYDDLKAQISIGKGDTEVTPETVIEHIVNQQTGDRRPKALRFKQATKSLFEPYTIDGYFAQVPAEFNWAEFFEGHLTESHEANEDLLRNRRSRHKAFFIFIYTDAAIYCFSGGLGYHYIKNFIEDDFGIAVLETLELAPETQFTSLTTKSIVGNVAQDRRNFRDTQRAVDEKNLGKIYQQASAKLRYSEEFRHVLETIFEGDTEKSKNVVASQGLKFAKSISLNELKRVVDFAEGLDLDNRRFTLSPLKPVKRDKDYGKLKITRLDLLLAEQLFESIQSIHSGAACSPLLYEIAHKHFELFYGCDSLVLRRGRTVIGEFETPYGLQTSAVLNEIVANDIAHFSQLAAQIRRLRNPVEIQKRKAEAIHEYSLECVFDNDGPSRPLKGKLVEFVNCEVREFGKSYFSIDGVWHLSRQNFVESLNGEFETIYELNQAEIEINDWFYRAEGARPAKEDENTYLEHMALQRSDNVLVMHKITPNKIELCDFLTWTDRDLFVCHVKPAFDGNVRVLTNQIIHSCALIQENLITGDSEECVLRKYYNSARLETESPYRNLVRDQFLELEFNDFFALFTGRNIHYVACIVDTVGDRDLGDIEQFDSSIAKMCAIDAYRSMRTIARPTSRFLFKQIRILAG